ncbi:MAG: hypothetical protein HC824_20495 [Synechococcales cyanobacterium RM1_1_8]|nr:hypothetical protein [Synechococcales cyanobacterium RM1_1_8]
MARFKARLPSRHLLRRLRLSRDKGAIFIAPDETGSLGDGAMLQAGVDYLKQQGFSKFCIVYPQYIDDEPKTWDHISGVNEYIGVQYLYQPENNKDAVIASLKRYWQDLARFVGLSKSYGYVYCIGADVVDGYYSTEICDFLSGLMSLAHAAGANTTLAGFSFNKIPKPQAVELLNAVPRNVRFCSRDPFSQHRAQQTLSRPVELVADLAFLLQPMEQSPQVKSLLAWVLKEQSFGRIVIGVNTNAMLLRSVEGLTVEGFIEHYIQTLEQLSEAQPNLSYLMLPHDDRYEIHDVYLTQLLLEQLSPTMRSRCNSLAFPCAPGEVKAICRDLDLVVASRMHVAIAALGQGTPTLSITYQDKHEGLYEHFNLSELLVTPEEAFQPQGLVRRIQACLPKREALRQKIEAKLPQVMALARANFSL